MLVVERDYLLWALQAGERRYAALHARISMLEGSPTSWMKDCAM